MQKLFKLTVVLFCIALVSGCTLPRGAALSSEILNEQQSENPTFSVVPVTRANVVDIAKWPTTGWSGRYHWLRSSRGPNSPIIHAGDLINLVIWDSQENSLLTSQTQKLVNMSGLVVSSAGTIFVPYLNQISVTGKTPDQARTAIQNALEPIVPSAQVQLAVTPGKQNSVDLVTGVLKPGAYPLPDRNFSILGLLAQGGGIAPSLRNPLVRLIRNGKTYETPASELFSNANRNITLRGNDKVLVEEDKRYFTSLGATGKETMVYFTKEYITALEALSMIGGFSDDRANLKGVMILREYPRRAVRSNGTGPEMQQVIFTFDLTSADALFASRSFQVNPNDTVFVTESPITSARTVLGLVGAVFNVANVLK